MTTIAATTTYLTLTSIQKMESASTLVAITILKASGRTPESLLATDLRLSNLSARTWPS